MHRTSILEAHKEQKMNDVKRQRSQLFVEN
jgi:hypothetical protein